MGASVDAGSDHEVQVPAMRARVDPARRDVAEEMPEPQVPVFAMADAEGPAKEDGVMRRMLLRLRCWISGHSLFNLTRGYVCRRCFEWWTIK